MTTANLTSSASLPSKMWAFGALFTVLSVAFPPAAAFVLTMLAAGFMSDL